MNNLLPEGIDLIRTQEACKLKAYLDETDRIWTIGWGHTGPEVYEGLTWTQYLADQVLLTDITHTMIGLNHLLGMVLLTDYKYSSLVSFVYNIGIEAFAGSTVLHYIIGGWLEKVPDQMKKWIYVHKRDGSVAKSQILQNRREREIALWNKNDQEIH